MTKAVLWTAFALAWAASSGDAQQLSPLPPSGETSRALTWEDCVAIAARQNPSLTAADYARDASRASYFGSYNGILPTLNLTNSYSSSKGTGIFNPTAGKPFYTAQASANWSLINMGQVANIRTARANYSSAQANQRQASASLRFNLFSAFVGVYFARKSVEVNKRIVEIQKNNADAVTLRYQAGREYKGNMMNSRAQLLSDQANVYQSMRALRVAQKALDQQLGVDEFTDFAVTGTLTYRMPPDFPSRMSDFLALRPDVAVQEAAVDGARAALASAESPLFPSLSANFSRSRSGPTEFPSSNYLWSAGATLSLPIFAGGPTAALFNVKAARNTLENQRQELRAVRQAALVSLESAWANYANAVDQVIGDEALLASNRQRNDEAQVRYASGLLTFDNWQVIISQWVNSEQSTIQAQQAALTAQAAWEQALGKALGE